jgi:hypothetical protein
MNAVCDLLSIKADLASAGASDRQARSHSTGGFIGSPTPWMKASATCPLVLVAAAAAA